MKVCEDCKHYKRVEGQVLYHDGNICKISYGPLETDGVRKWRSRIFIKHFREEHCKGDFFVRKWWLLFFGEK